MVSTRHSGVNAKWTIKNLRELARTPHTVTKAECCKDFDPLSPLLTTWLSLAPTPSLPSEAPPNLNGRNSWD